MIAKIPSYLRNELIPLVLGADVSASVKNYLEQCRSKLLEKMEQKFPIGRTVRLQSILMDQLVTALYQRGFEQSQVSGVATMPVALFALGGYGRAELNLYSDIDLLFIYEGKTSTPLETFTKNMLYPLWDAKVEVGYATRTIQDCGRVMQQDIRAFSSMLDARYLAGDPQLAAKFTGYIEKKISSAKSFKRYVREKNQENEERLGRFGGSVYVIEPNLKESEGGLRDWHTLRYFARIALKTPDIEEWVRRGLINNEDADRLRRALDFIWEVRNRLHHKAGRNQDQLMFEYQEPIALEMGFESGDGTLAVEKFMQTYYCHAADLFKLRKEIAHKLLREYTPLLHRITAFFRRSLSPFYLQIRDKIVPKNYKKLEKHPVEILRAFHLAQKRNLILGEGFKAWISRNLHLVGDDFRILPEVGAMLREMFSDMAGIGAMLKEMHDCRFLGALIPEFGDILFQTQHDVYHVYTVDTHSILAVEELSKLKRGEYDQEFPLFKQALGEVKNHSVLVLGVLFHDIGKGKGGRHSEVGAKLAQQIMTRIGYPQEERDAVEFLVLSHLIMPHLSQRRDLDDANLILQFAQTMGSLQLLNLLFILTWADIRAVGPDVWTPWKGELLRKLYQKTRYVLETGDFSTDRASVIMEQVRIGTLSVAPKHVLREKLEEFLNAMPPRYFVVHHAEAILEHYEIIQSRKTNLANLGGVVFHQSPNVRFNYNEVLIYTVNNPQIFEQVTGVLSSAQINILALEQFFDATGQVLLLLKVTDHQGKMLEEARRFENLKQDLSLVLSGQLALETYREKNRSAIFTQQATTTTTRPPRVEIDNDVSPYYTIIDIYAQDRIGILYDLARVLRELKLFIEISKISTKVDQVADVFYVKDIFGHKIKDRKKLKEIKGRILQVLVKETRQN